jgi:hypothetical protein
MLAVPIINIKNKALKQGLVGLLASGAIAIDSFLILLLLLKIEHRICALCDQ